MKQPTEPSHDDPHANACRRCGCVDSRACATKYGPCFWWQADLCSSCADPLQDELQFDAASRTLIEATAAMRLVVKGGELYMLVTAIQLLCRKPDFTGPTRVYVEGFARQLQHALQAAPQLYGSLEMGWDRALDVPGAPQEERRIITP